MSVLWLKPQIVQEPTALQLRLEAKNQRHYHWKNQAKIEYLKKDWASNRRSMLPRVIRVRLPDEYTQVVGPLFQTSTTLNPVVTIKVGSNNVIRTSIE